MKIYDWKKFLTFIAVVLLLIATILYGCSKKNPEVKEIIDYEVQSGETYIVQRGDTIWGISARIREEKELECDIRKIVYQIREDNKIKDCGSIQIGQCLMIRGAY